MRRVALVLALLVGACGGGGNAVDSAVEGQPAAEAPAAGSAVTPVSFSAPAVGGGQVDAADYAGRDLVLWFWAPW